MLRSFCLVLFAVHASASAYLTLEIHKPLNNQYALMNSGSVRLEWDEGVECVEVKSQQIISVITVDGRIDRIVRGVCHCDVEVEEGWHQFEVVLTDADGFAGSKALVEFYAISQNQDKLLPSPVALGQPTNTEFEDSGDSMLFELQLEVEKALLAGGKRFVRVFLDGEQYADMGTNQMSIPVYASSPGTHTISWEIDPNFDGHKSDNRKVERKSFTYTQLPKESKPPSECSCAPVSKRGERLIVPVTETERIKSRELIARGKEARAQNDIRKARTLYFAAMIADPNNMEGRGLLRETGHFLECPSHSLNVTSPIRMILSHFSFYFEYRTDVFGTHQPLLHKLAMMTTGPILEIGTGLHSTRMLNAICRVQNRKLISVDYDAAWMRKFSDLESNYHHFVLAENLESEEFKEYLSNDDWGVVLIDHGSWADRLRAARRLAYNAQYIVLHDADYYMHYDQLYFDEFRYFKEFFPARPWLADMGPGVVVFSEFHNLGDLAVDFSCYEGPHIHSAVPGRPNSYFHAKPPNTYPEFYHEPKFVAVLS